MLGLTATSTMSTAVSVAQHLGIQDPESATIRGTPVPDNLMLSVSRDDDRDSVSHFSVFNTIEPLLGDHPSGQIKVVCSKLVVVQEGLFCWVQIVFWASFGIRG